MNWRALACGLSTVSRGRSQRRGCGYVDKWASHVATWLIPERSARAAPRAARGILRQCEAPVLALALAHLKKNYRERQDKPLAPGRPLRIASVSTTAA